MSVQTIHADHGTAHAHPAELAHQFVDMEQQNEIYIVGMWTFLVTEIMFFGALFLAYTTYRTLNAHAFWEAHKHVNVVLGATNTMVLLTSSLFMALGVYCAQIKHKTGQLFWIALTILCAFGFLVIKGFEYKAKIDDHLVPGATFHYVPAAEAIDEEMRESSAGHPPAPVPGGKAEMFFMLYFCMTGLHGIHVIIGIIVLTTLWIMIKFNHPLTRYYMWVEMAGLYWHFVDIVWIFLFPLYYLIPKA